MTDLVSIALTSISIHLSSSAELPSLTKLIVEPKGMKYLSSLRFFDVPILKEIHRTEEEVMSPFNFPSMVNFLYHNISPELLECAQLPAVVDDRHPNENFRDLEYQGHVCHELEELTPDYIEKMRREFRDN